MDPWKSIGSVDNQLGGIDEGDTRLDSFVSSGPLLFDDHFVPALESKTPVIKKPFDKLPDSETYLASLEKKLHKIQSSSGKNKGKEILKSLEESRESCLLNLLASNSLDLHVDHPNFEEFKVNPLLKKIQPDRQALSAEELILLVKADQLGLVQQEEEESEGK